MGTAKSLTGSNLMDRIFVAVLTGSVLGVYLYNTFLFTPFYFQNKTCNL